MSRDAAEPEAAAAGAMARLISFWSAEERDWQAIELAIHDLGSAAALIALKQQVDEAADASDAA
jgi:hypothetical protein